MQSNQTLETGTITSTLVVDKQRLLILPELFPTAFIEVEGLIFDVARKISETYDKRSGYWHFHRLSNGGFFMSPAIDERLEVIIPFGNQFSGKMSAEAFGITVTLYAYCFLAERHPASKFADHYQRLYSFMTEHVESTMIWQAID